MPRYVVQPRGEGPLSEVAQACRSCGGRAVRLAPASRQAFCDLTEEQARRLAQRYAVAVKPVRGIRTQQAPSAGLRAGPAAALAPAEALEVGDVLRAAGFGRLRDAFGLSGVGTTIAVLDSGVRSSHRELSGRVVLEENLSASPTAGDVFNHGTAVAHAAAGEGGVAPGASLMSLKVLGDDGLGSAEDAVMALERVVELKERALAQGLPDSHPLHPDIINMSWGLEDDGDPQDPLSRAVRAAASRGLGLIAAAGNEGPAPGTILCPACEPEVVAVGALTLLPYEVWPASSRGPTLLGLTKPDVAFFGVGLRLASAEGDGAYVTKSGTSFAAPQVAGMVALGKELGFRAGALDSLERGFGLVGLGLVKPTGVSTAKDNAWGWGQPSGELLLRRLQAPTTDASALAAPLALALLATLITGLR